MKRYLLPLLCIGLVLVALWQYTVIRQLRTDARLYDTKVENAFRYTVNHMDLNSLPDALEKLAAAPSTETVEHAKAAAEEYTALLRQLNDLRAGGAPSVRLGGISTGTYTYLPSTQAQADLEMQIHRARLWPPLYGLGARLAQNGGQLRPEDKQFLADALRLVRQANQKLTAAGEAAAREEYMPSVFVIAKDSVGALGPDLAALETRIKEYTGTP